MSGKSGHKIGDFGQDVGAIERSMVAIRRAQTRRALARLSAHRGARGGRYASLPDAVFELLDAVDAGGSPPAQPPTVSEAALAMGVDQPRASRLAAQALDAGLLRRGVDQTDGRRSPLILTAAGRTALERIRAFRSEVIAEATHDWTGADRMALARLLTRFVTDIAAVTGAVTGTVAGMVAPSSSPGPAAAAAADQVR